MPLEFLSVSTIICDYSMALHEQLINLPSSETEMARPSVPYTKPVPSRIPDMPDPFRIPAEPGSQPTPNSVPDKSPSQPVTAPTPKEPVGV